MITLIVEGKNDVKRISDVFKEEVGVVPFYGPNFRGRIDEASQKGRVYIMTDPDKTGDQLARQIMYRNASIAGRISVDPDQAKTNDQRKGRTRYGVEYCRDEYLRRLMDPYIKMDQFEQGVLNVIMTVWGLDKKEAGDKFKEFLGGDTTHVDSLAIHPWISEKEIMKILQGHSELLIQTDQTNTAWLSKCEQCTKGEMIRSLIHDSGTYGMELLDIIMELIKDDPERARRVEEMLGTPDYSPDARKHRYINPGYMTKVLNAALEENPVKMTEMVTANILELVINAAFGLELGTEESICAEYSEEGELINFLQLKESKMV